MYSFNTYQMVISNANGSSKFYAIDINSNVNTGISSSKFAELYNDYNYSILDIESIRMDKFITMNNIDSIDFLKIDVEGSSYEVLEGFGNYLSIVKSIHIEGEYKEVWRNQRLFPDISNLLHKNGFVLVYYELHRDSLQNDSFWVQHKYIR